MRIDSHHHFWRYTPAEYDWIDERMAALRRDFLPPDLQAETRAAGIDGVVSVQARQTVGETEWLLEMARENAFIRGVVGWVPLVAPDVAGILERFAAQPKLRAVRHVLQGESDERFMLRDDFNAGVRALQPHGLVYDLLVLERQLPQTIEFVDRHPAQVFVLDHAAKPRITDGAVEPWKTQVRELARRQNVFCKVSGMVTEADWTGWSDAGLRPYFDVLWEAFGPARLMFGSDWPVCLVACSYGRWVQTVEGWAAAASDDERRQLFGATAAAVYRLP